MISSSSPTRFIAANHETDLSDLYPHVLSFPPRLVNNVNHTTSSMNSMVWFTGTRVANQCRCLDGGILAHFRYNILAPTTPRKMRTLSEPIFRAIIFIALGRHPTEEQENEANVYCRRDALANVCELYLGLVSKNTEKLLSSNRNLVVIVDESLYTLQCFSSAVRVIKKTIT